MLQILDYARTNARTKSFAGIMKYLIAKHEGKEKALRINKGKFYLLLTRRGDYKLNYTVSGKKESVSSETFRKRFYQYLQPVKRLKNWELSY